MVTIVVHQDNYVFYLTEQIRMMSSGAYYCFMVQVYHTSVLFRSNRVVVHDYVPDMDEGWGIP